MKKAFTGIIITLCLLVTATGLVGCDFGNNH